MSPYETVHAAAAALLDLAAKNNLVVTIETQPTQPLAMGNYNIGVCVRPMRHPEPLDKDLLREINTAAAAGAHHLAHKGAAVHLSLEGDDPALPDESLDCPACGGSGHASDLDSHDLLGLMVARVARLRVEVRDLQETRAAVERGPL